MVIFVGLLLGLMYLAAAPLFRLFWNEGGFFDRAMVLGFYGLIGLFPFAVLFCWFFEEVVTLHRAPDGSLRVEAFRRFLGVKWGQSTAASVGPENLMIANWKGAENVASIEAKENGQTDRYATKGHWLLLARVPGTELILERRAKREEIEELRAQIEAFRTGTPLFPG